MKPPTAKTPLPLIHPKFKLPVAAIESSRIVVSSRTSTPKSSNVALPTETSHTKAAVTGPAVSASKGKPKGRPPKSAKAGHTPKAQSGGMSTVDYRASRAALKKLNTNKHAKLFLQPVDPIRDHAPELVFFDRITPF